MYKFFGSHVSKLELDLSIDKTSVIQEFLDVFLKELLGLTLEQEIKFNIEFASNTTPI